MRCPSRCVTLVLLFLFVFSCLGAAVCCRSGVLVLEWEQHWETYGVGGTCNFGTHNFFVGDVDDDGTPEMVTGGLMYYITEEKRTTLEAPFRIWNWNGEAFNLEKSLNWPGVINSIYAADSDGDSSTEIITSGALLNSTGRFPSLRVWSYDGENLVLKANFEGIFVNAIFVGDSDNDGQPEILTAGTVDYTSSSKAQLCIWRLNGNSLSLLKSVEWCSASNASANSVFAYDLDGDGTVEIVTGGYDRDLTNSSGQLRVWRWNGQELSLKANEEWRMVEGSYGVTISGAPMGNTMVENVKVADVDGDGSAEVVSGGFTFDGEKVNAQLRIWRWNGYAFILEESCEWTTADITEVKSISLNDVDADGTMEIVTSGLTGYYGSFGNTDVPPESAQLRVWSWNGQTLSLECAEEWQIGEGVVAWNVGTGDVDQDGTVEIVTVGCMAESALCDPDLRIWSIPKDESDLTEVLVVLIGAVVAVIVLLGFLVFRRRRSVRLVVV